MKLAPLLAQYLYDQKKLELAGIGTFSLDPSARKNIDAQHLSEGISFQYNNPAGEDDDLISYISSETGKMKPLASSDLNSYIELAREFLNIGKPFQIEGIGTLVKNKSGELEFTADHLLFDKVKETGIKELSATSISDESLTTYESLKPHSEKSPIPKRVFLAFLAIATIVLIIWISYRTYKNGSGENSEEPNTTTETIPVNDTTKNIPQATDSASMAKQVPVKTSGGNTYRFVVEVANRKRAMYRYNTLRKTNVPIQIATTDSVTYKLFFTLAATPGDTARMADSLTTWYPAMNHKKAFAEK